MKPRKVVAVTKKKSESFPQENRTVTRQFRACLTDTRHTCTDYLIYTVMHTYKRHTKSFEKF